MPLFGCGVVYRYIAALGPNPLSYRDGRGGEAQRRRYTRLSTGRIHAPHHPADHNVFPPPNCARAAPCRFTPTLMSSGGLQHRYTRTGGARPYGVACLVAGFDEDTLLPSVFRSEPSGAFAEWSASAVGKGSEKVSIPPAADVVFKHGLRGLMWFDSREWVDRELGVTFLRLVEACAWNGGRGHRRRRKKISG